ncbi:MAG: hypothetical protein PHW52_01060 [Candidatus Pacebacteria bacterium]|nr:hypothetical protein [Candidatus Paceibacterota bacterium]
MEKSKKGSILYIPVVLYICIFSLFVFFAPIEGFQHFFSLFSFFGFAQLQIFILFEFLLLSILIYEIAKRIRKDIAPYREKELFPMIVSVGYIIWSTPIILYALTCREKFCGLVVLYPLSFTLYLGMPISYVCQNSFCGFIVSWAINIALIYFGLRFFYSKKKKKGSLDNRKIFGDEKGGES